MSGGRGPGIKGKGYEREVVEKIAAHGITSERTWGSDGRSRGLAKEVDIVIHAMFSGEDDVYGQSKRPKKLPAYMCVPEGETLHIVDLRTGAEWQVLHLSDYCRLYKRQAVLLKEGKRVTRQGIGFDLRPDLGSGITFQVMRQNHDKKGDRVVISRSYFLSLIGQACLPKAA